MVESDSELDLGNSDEEDEEVDIYVKDREDAGNDSEEYKEVSVMKNQKSLISNENFKMSKRTESDLYTINEEEERETIETKYCEKLPDLSGLELYFKQLIEGAEHQVT